MTTSSSIFNIREETIGKLLKTEKLIVPLYQRSYSWYLEAIEFFEDILERTKKEVYFIGPMVFSKANNEYIVIDGQQRLITTCLLLIALRDLCYHFDIKDGEERLGDKINNIYINKSTALYLQPTLSIIPNRIDKKFFELITKTSGSFDEKNKRVKNKLKEKKYESWKKLWKVYSEFYKRLKKKLENIMSEEERKNFVYEIAKILDENVKIVVIEVDSELNAFLVFETLNAKGVQLAPIDLIKNYLFSLIRDESEIERNEALWSRFLEDVESNELTMIIRYYLIYKHGFLKEKEIFRKIKEIITTKDEAIEFIKEVSKFLKYYIHIIFPSLSFWENEEIVDWLEDLRILKVRQHIPIIFALLEKYDEKKEIKKKLRPLYIILTRRIICKKLPNEIERKLEDICKAIKEGKGEGYLRHLTSLNPKDEEVRTCLMEYEFKDTKQKHLAKALLRFINNSKSKEIKTNRELTLEHIWPESKSSELANPDIVYRIGNLTLLPEKFNKNCGDKAFLEKRKIYEESQLSINKELLKFEKWGENEIYERSEKISKEIVKLLKF